MGITNLIKSIVPRTPLPDYESVDAKYERHNLLFGSEWNCRNNQKRKRQDVIAKLAVGAPIAFEVITVKYNGKKRKALMAIDPATNLDIGEVGYDISEMVLSKYPGSQFVGRVEEVTRLPHERHKSVLVEYKIY